MTLAKWDESVRIAKIRMNLDPNDFSVIKGKLLKEAQIIYKILLNDN
jgi:tRNA A22 N-methylase|tara:strand:+ start:7564 stop:7704 length:141 start_codon:yes stop_codon:yes gene_type:complete